MGFRLIWKKSEPRKHNRSQSSQLMTWSISRIRKLFLPFKINPSTSGGLGSGRKQKLFISQLHFALPLSPDSGMYVANARAISCAENSTRHLSPDVNTKMTDPQDFPQSATPPPLLFTHHTCTTTHTLFSPHFNSVCAQDTGSGSKHGFEIVLLIWRVNKSNGIEMVKGFTLN